MPTQPSRVLNNKLNLIKKIIFILLFTLIGVFNTYSQESIIDGKRKYRTKEDNPEFSKKDFNDSGWGELDTLEWKVDISGIARYLVASIDRRVYEIK